jgi:hypothetical protein
MADNIVARFLGGSPVAVLFRLFLVSVIVGAFLMLLDIRPAMLLHTIQRLIRRIVLELGEYFLAGALLVLPIWLVIRLLNWRRYG